jgi:hypothetical protein
MPCAKGMGKCHKRCLHRASVLAYRDSRDAWEALRETCHQMEPDEFRRAYPPPTFKNWLIGSARSRVDVERRQEVA